MDLVISSFPGFAFTCSLLFLLLGAVESFIYYRTGYKRSLSIALFCFFSSFYAFEQFVAQSRSFSPLTVYYFCMFAQMALLLSTCFYIKAMGFYVAFSSKFYQVAKWSFCILCISFSAFLPYNLFTGKIMFLNIQDFQTSGSYFYDSYMAIGTPTLAAILLMTAYSLISAVVSVSMFIMVWRGSRDRFLMLGLFFSVAAALYQHVLLPFTLEYYVPVIFITNLFEALRMSFLSLREYILEQSNKEPVKGKESSSSKDLKYQNTNFDIERLQALAEKLKVIMADEKPYIDPNLRLEELGRKIEVPSYQLTQVIKLIFHKSFKDYINGYRIELVKQKLQKAEFKDFSIIDIAYKSGFNSKSTFNTAFKKFTNMTPSEYRKGLKKES